MARKNQASSSKPVEVKRLTPKTETLRELYLKSGNICAFPKCNSVIINNDGTMVGHICHIEAAKSDGSRFNISMSNEERRSGRNLILLCANHHTVVDGNAVKYTVDELVKMKRLHEERFSEVNDTLKRWFEEKYVDNTTQYQESQPKTLKRLRDWFEKKKIKFVEDDVKKTLSQIGSYVKKARVVPQSERDFMKALFERAKRLEFKEADGSVSVDFEDFKSALKYPATKIKNQIALLERYGVGGMHLEDEDRASLCLEDPCDRVTWSDISDFCADHTLGIEQFIIEQKFALLD